MVLIREDDQRPANLCPLVPVSMSVEVGELPDPGHVKPVEHENRPLASLDNRRLVGKVAQVLIDHTALHTQAAVRLLSRAQREDSVELRKKADGYAMQVRDRARRALRGVDLEELARAVEVETRAAGSEPIAVSPGLTIEFVNKDLAVVSEGGTRVEVKGPRLVPLFRIVVEADGHTVAWSDLVRADLAACSEELDRRWRGQALRRRDRDGEDDDGEGESGGDLVTPTTPRHAIREDSLMRAGTRIRKALGKLGYHWHQDRNGARWDREVS